MQQSPTCQGRQQSRSITARKTDRRHHHARLERSPRSTRHRIPRTLRRPPQL